MELSGTFALAHTLLGDLALRETRTVTILTDHELPRGKYTFAEAFCLDPACDCRRIQIWVMRGERSDILATIAMGLDAETFHRTWCGAGFDEDAYLAGTPTLEPAGKQSEMAGKLLRFFCTTVLPSDGYFERLRTHYRQFKEAARHARAPYRSAPRAGRNEP